MIRSPRRPCTSQPAVGGDLAEVTGREPSVDGRDRSIAIATQQHRTAQVDLAVGIDPNLDAVERVAVVDHAASRLGHPIRRHDVVGQVVGRRAIRRARSQRKDARVDSPQRRRHERDQRGALPCCCSDRFGIESVVHDEA